MKIFQFYKLSTNESMISTLPTNESAPLWLRISCWRREWGDRRAVRLEVSAVMKYSALMAPAGSCYFAINQSDLSDIAAARCSSSTPKIIFVILLSPYFTALHFAIIFTQIKRWIPMGKEDIKILSLLSKDLIFVINYYWKMIRVHSPKTWGILYSGNHKLPYWCINSRYFPKSLNNF